MNTNSAKRIQDNVRFDEPFMFAVFSDVLHSFKYHILNSCKAKNFFHQDLQHLGCYSFLIVTKRKVVPILQIIFL